MPHALWNLIRAILGLLVVLPQELLDTSNHIEGAHLVRIGVQRSHVVEGVHQPLDQGDIQTLAGRQFQDQRVHRVSGRVPRAGAIA